MLITRRPAALAPRLFLMVMATIAVMAIFSAPSAKAATRDYWGCLICKPLTGTQTAEYCGTPANNGDGYNHCRETDNSIYGQLCQLRGEPCLFVCFGNCDPGGGGTGGGGTGGGGGTCGGDAYCPPSCFDCGGIYY